MEKTFTPKQVMLCEVEYSLEGFWHDLAERVFEKYPSISKAGEGRLISCQRAVYQVLYFAFNFKSPEEIDESLKIPTGMAEAILACHVDDFEMLKSVIMGMFLRNLQESSGILSDDQNLRLVNAQLRIFHQKYHL